MKKEIVNDTGIPDWAFMRIAECLYPYMVEFCTSEQGKKEFAEWQAKQNQNSKTEKTNLDICFSVFQN